MKEIQFNSKDIILKWYHTLKFDKKYDKDFNMYLESIPIPVDTKIETYPINCEDGKKNFLAFLYMCEALEQKYKSKGISNEILHDTLHDLVIWSDVWSDLKGQLWLGELDWLSNHLSGLLFKLGRLQFAIQRFEEDVAAFGIQRGAVNIGVHIPAVGPLKPELCKESFSLANDFFAKYFPEITYTFYTCHSWLLDDTLRELLPVESNILKFGDMFKKISREKSDAILKYVFKWDTRRHNLHEVESTSDFSKKVKEHIYNDKDFYSVFGIIEK